MVALLLQGPGVPLRADHHPADEHRKQQRHADP
jgi:hypothetical protein